MNTDYRILGKFSPTLVAIVLWLWTGYQPESLIFDRDAIAHGELWRLFSGHFVHCDGRHLVLNLLGIFGLTHIFNKLTAGEIWGALLLGTAAVDAWNWFGMDNLYRYCGLSGIENALLVKGLHTIWKQERRWSAILFGGLSLAKICYEILHEDALFTRMTWPSVPEAHAAGFFAGLLLVAGTSLFHRLRTTATLPAPPKSLGKV